MVVVQVKSAGVGRGVGDGLLLKQFVTGMY